VDIDMVVVPAAAVHLAVVGDEAVLLSERDGQYFGLNATATFVWHLLRDRVPLSTIQARLVETFDAPEAVLRADLIALIERLRGAGLVSS
jgi:hypothetical protein